MSTMMRGYHLNSGILKGFLHPPRGYYFMTVCWQDYANTTGWNLMEKKK